MLFSKDDLKRLLIPLLLEQLLVVTIGMADTVMVSSCGEAAVSGVSLVDSINVLLISFFSALATGGAVVTSQYLGKRDRASASLAAKQLFYVILALSLLMTLPCVALRKPILDGIFGAIEPDVMQNAMSYFLLTALSYPFLALYNGSAALLRSMGNAKASLNTSIIMNLVNVAGNALTIYGLGMGVVGAGLATLVSRAVGAAAMQHALKSPVCLIPYPTLRKWEWRGDMVRRILSVGLPNGFENGLFQMGKLLLLRLVSSFGTVSIAANAVANTMSTIQVLPGNAVSLGLITVVGRCAGAGEYEQARLYTKKLMTLAYVCMGALNAAMLLCNPFIAAPFNLSADTEALARALIALHGAGCIVLWPLSFTLPNALRAAGDARFTMIVSSLSMLLCRIAIGYLLARTLVMGVMGVWIAMQIDWVCRVAFFVSRYRGDKWETKALV